MSGDSFLFSTQVDSARARQLMSGVKRTSPLTLSYESSDALARLIAERIALNAREIGLHVQAIPASGSSMNSDLRLARILRRSSDPAVALQETAAAAGLNLQLSGSSVEEIYTNEKKLLAGYSVIPLFQMPIASMTGESIRNWPEDPLGGWPLADVFLDRPGDPQRP
jgi:hypothetical protein